MTEMAETHVELNQFPVPRVGPRHSTISRHSPYMYFLMKLFKSSNINLINDDFRYYFNFELPSELLMERKDKFIEKFMASQRLLGYFAIQ